MASQLLMEILRKSRSPHTALLWPLRMHSLKPQQIDSGGVIRGLYTQFRPSLSSLRVHDGNLVVEEALIIPPVTGILLIFA